MKSAEERTLPLLEWREKQAQIATDRAIANAERGAGDEWCAEALEAVRTCAATLESFTSDDVRKFVADPPEPRAWGAVFRRAQSLGIVRATTEFRVVRERVSSHQRPMRVWRAA